MHNEPKSIEVIEKTVKALIENGMEAIVAKDAENAKNIVLGMIPKDASVMTMTSVTLEETGIAKEINESGNFNSARKKLESTTDEKEKKIIANIPDFVVGSVHAITEDGKVIIASNTGSQLPAYVYTSNHVIWVVGSQKIVKDLDEGVKRLYDYVLPLESERARVAYGVPGSFVSKFLVVNKEVNPGRVIVVFVPEKLGF